jgi:vancomycin resistance protein YoaR
MWEYAVGGGDEDPVVRVDQPRLDAALAAIAQHADSPAVEGRITFAEGEATPRYPEDGTVVDRPAAAAAVRAAFLGPRTTVELPTTVAKPTITGAAVSRAMDTFANPAMSGPVVVRLDGEGVRVEPDEFAPALSMVADGGRLTPVLDPKALDAVLAPKMKQITVEGRDATVRLVAGRPGVVPARTGVGYDPDQAADGFLGVLGGTGSGRTLQLNPVETRPKVTTAQATAWRIKQRVSSFTTHFPYADYRNVNLTRAAHLVDGTVLKPGDTFSLNKVVGERTAQNGFTKGFIINDGVFKEDFGGGVSQVATTTFNAAFFAGLEDVEHKAHSFYIDRYPVGREATVAWPSVDLKFKNTTPYGVLISASVDKSTPTQPGSMHVSMWSTKYWDVKAETGPRYNLTSPRTRHLQGSGCVPHEGYGGFDIDVSRLFYRHGSDVLDHREKIHTHYTPSDTVVCG